MTDPKRWLDDDGGATDTERDLLRSADGAEPPRGAEDSVWAAIAGRIPPAGGGGTGGGGGAGGGGPAAGGTAIVAKGKVLGALFAVALVAGGLVYTSRPTLTLTPMPTPTPTPTSTTTPTPTSTPTPTTTTTTNPTPTTTTAATATTTATATARKPPPSVDPDALREESALIARARDALHGGDPSGALAILDTARTRFPNGVLGQERQVLGIEALAASGDRDGAARQARSFLQKYPKSPLASRVRAFL